MVDSCYFADEETGADMKYIGNRFGGKTWNPICCYLCFTSVISCPLRCLLHRVLIDKLRTIHVFQIQEAG